MVASCFGDPLVGVTFQEELVCMAIWKCELGPEEAEPRRRLEGLVLKESDARPNTYERVETLQANYDQYNLYMEQETEERSIVLI